MRTGTLPYFNAPADTRRCLPCTIIICAAQKYVNEVFENIFRKKRIQTWQTKYGGEHHSGHPRTKRPAKGQAAKTSSYIYHATADGAEICERVE